jgi:hypothetical protein
MLGTVLKRRVLSGRHDTGWYLSFVVLGKG